MGLPPLPGAVQVTVALPSPGTAATAVGAAGTVGGAVLPPLSTTVAISHVVDEPLATAAAGVAPPPTGRSSASVSMSLAGATRAGGVKPPAAVRESPNPESA